MHTEQITCPGVMQYPCSTREEGWWADHCLRQCVGIAVFNFCLFIYLTSAYGKHRCGSHLHDGNPRTPVHCRGERAAAFTPEQGTTVKCCWAAAAYWTLNYSDMPFWCTERFSRNCKALHVCIFGYLNGKGMYWKDLACSRKGWKKCSELAVA